MHALSDKNVKKIERLDTKAKDNKRSITNILYNIIFQVHQIHGKHIGFEDKSCSNCMSHFSHGYSIWDM